MTETRGTTLDAFVKESAIVGIKGANDFARKLLYDYQDGKLTYTNPADLSILYYDSTMTTIPAIPPVTATGLVV